MKMVGLGKPKREPAADPSSLGSEEPGVRPQVEEVKPREPLSGKDQAHAFPPGSFGLDR